MVTFVNPDLLDSIRADSNVIGGDKFREIFCAVATVAANCVEPSLGPYGGTSLIDESTTSITATKDGINALEQITFTDPTWNVIFRLLKKISFNSAAKVGDGTTTAMITAANFLNLMYGEFIPSIQKKKSKFRQADFIAASKIVAEMIEKELRSDKYLNTIDPDGDFSDIYKIAHIATNGNNGFAQMIQDAYVQTKNPYIRLVTGAIPKTTMTLQDGYRFDCRVLNPEFYINTKDGGIDFSSHSTRIKLVIFDHALTFQRHKDLISYFSEAGSREGTGTMYIIMAPHFDDVIAISVNSVLKQLAQSRRMPSIMMVQIPIVTDLHTKILTDLGVIAGCRLFDANLVEVFNILHHNEMTVSEDELIKSDLLTTPGFEFKHSQEVTATCTGMIDSVIFNGHEGFILNYRNDSNREKIAALEAEATEAFKVAREKAMRVVNGTTEKDYLFTQMRYLQFKGNRATITVGGLSEIDRKRDKDALEDAILACRSAYEDGYVRGMNLEILQVIHDLMKSEDMFEYEFEVLDLLYKAFYRTSISVMMNKEPNNEEHRNVKVMTLVPGATEVPTEEVPTEQYLANTDIIDFALTEPNRYDYDLRTEKMHPYGHWEVINSASTDIEILKSVISILTTAMTSYQFISTTHRFDPIINNETTLNRQIREMQKMEAAKTDAILTALNTDKGDQLLIKLGAAISTSLMDILGPDVPDMDDGLMDDLLDSEGNPIEE